VDDNSFRFMACCLVWQAAIPFCRNKRGGLYHFHAAPSTLPTFHTPTAAPPSTASCLPCPFIPLRLLAGALLLCVHSTNMQHPTTVLPTTHILPVLRRSATTRPPHTFAPLPQLPPMTAPCHTLDRHSRLLHIASFPHTHLHIHRAVFSPLPHLHDSHATQSSFFNLPSLLCALPSTALADSMPQPFPAFFSCSSFFLIFHDLCTHTHPWCCFETWPAVLHT